MHIVALTHAEAADPVVLRNLMRSLLGDGAPAVVKTIAHEDRPDVGAPPPPAVAPAAPVIPPPPAAAPVLDTAAIFGGAAAAAHPPAAAPSTAGAAAMPIAPAAPTSTPVAIVPSPSVLPTAPAAGAPMAPAAPSSPAGGAPAVDSAGLPWDARIHSRTKTTTNDGKWRQKRDTPPALVQQVEAELRQLMAIPAPAGVPVPPVAPPTPPAADPAAVAAPAAQPVLVPPAAPPVAAAPAPTAAEFMQWLTPYMTAGIINQQQLLEACKAEGLNGLPAVIQRPDLAPAVKARLLHLIPQAQ